MSTDPDQLLQHQIHYQVVNTLLRLLPPPIEATQASLDARNEAAIARVSQLNPVNADEIEIALHYVLSRAQAADVMLSIRGAAGDAARENQLLRQYALMERTAQADRRLLLKVQAERQKREAAAGAADTDIWTAYITHRRLQDAAAQGPVPLGMGQLPAEAPRGSAALPAELPPPQAMPDRPTAVPAQAASAPMAPAPHPTATPPTMPSQAAEQLLTAFAMALTGAAASSRNLEAEAEQYAIAHPRTARMIRLTGTLPADWDTDAPDQELMHAIYTADTPTLRSFSSAVAMAA